MIPAEICIPVIITLHIIGIISGYVIMSVLSRKNMLPNNAFWNDLQVLGGVIWTMAGILSPFIIWYNHKKEKK